MRILFLAPTACPGTAQSPGLVQGVGSVPARRLFFVFSVPERVEKVDSSSRCRCKHKPILPVTSLVTSQISPSASPVYRIGASVRSIVLLHPSSFSYTSFSRRRVVASSVGRAFLTCPMFVLRFLVVRVLHFVSGTFLRRSAWLLRAFLSSRERESAEKKKNVCVTLCEMVLSWCTRPTGEGGTQARMDV